MKFQFGDRVEATAKNMYGGVKPGDAGTVIAVDCGLAIRWDTWGETRHDCDLPDLCPEGYGTFVWEDEVEIRLEDDDFDGLSVQNMIDEVL